LPTITIDEYQKNRFKDVIDFVKKEPGFKNKRVKQSDAFELLLQLFETSISAGMTPSE